MSAPGRSVGRSAGVFVGYLVAFSLLCLPWLLSAAQSLPLASPNGRGDSRLLAWIFWWVSYALASDPSAIVDACPIDPIM